MRRHQPVSLFEECGFEAYEDRRSAAGVRKELEVGSAYSRGRPEFLSKKGPSTPAASQPISFIVYLLLYASVR